MSYRNNGGGSGGNNPPYTPSNNPDRSANNNRPNPHADPNARERSRGFRPLLCGVVQRVQAAVEIVGDVVEVVLDVFEPIQDQMDPFQDRLYNAVKDTAFVQALQHDAGERPLEGILAAVALDIVYDLASFALGHDLLTGEKLSHGEELFTFVAIAIPVVSIAAVKHGGKLFRGGKQVASHIDELGDGVKLAAKHADDLQDAARIATKHGDELLDGAELAAKNADDLAESQTIARRLDDWVSPDGEVARMGDEALERQRLSRQLDDANGVRHADDSFGGSCIPARNSFTAGTLVATETGEKPIETVEAGDKVLGEDPETGEQGYYEVVSVRNHLKDEVVEVTIELEGSEEVMETTPDHPVYVEEKGWMWAESLEAGDRLRTSDDSWAEVVAVEHVQLDEPELVYNFTVRGPHTYFVLETAVLVHNDSDVCGSFEAFESFREPNSQPRKRVIEPIPDFYGSARVENLPEGWEVIEGIEHTADGKVIIRTKASYIDNMGIRRQGLFKQTYSPQNNELSIDVAFLKDPQSFDQALPTMIRTPIPLIADKGTTPTAAFFLLHQMNKLDIPYGSLMHIKLDTVQNFNTVAHLDWLTKNFPTNTADDLIWDTQIVQFVRTPLIQSGHRINRSTIRVIDGIKIPAKHIKFQHLRVTQIRLLVSFSPPLESIFSPLVVDYLGGQYLFQKYLTTPPCFGILMATC